MVYAGQPKVDFRVSFREHTLIVVVALPRLRAADCDPWSFGIVGLAFALTLYHSFVPNLIRLRRMEEEQ